MISLFLLPMVLIELSFDIVTHFRFGDYTLVTLDARLGLVFFDD